MSPLSNALQSHVPYACHMGHHRCRTFYHCRKFYWTTLFIKIPKIVSFFLFKVWLSVPLYHCEKLTKVLLQISETVTLYSFFAHYSNLYQHLHIRLKGEGHRHFNVKEIKILVIFSKILLPTLMLWNLSNCLGPQGSVMSSKNQTTHMENSVDSGAVPWVPLLEGRMELV